ncbi:MAG: DUF2235 domain-containing protein [Thauera sp.]|nr:DUF2235 domain-containing protein [Thauera sp.]
MHARLTPAGHAAVKSTMSRYLLIALASLAFVHVVPGQHASAAEFLPEPSGQTSGGPSSSPSPGSLLPPIDASPASCTPSPGGATCGGDGAATQGSTSGGGVDVGAGNPINVTNGNKYQLEVDLPPLPGVLGIEIVRHYNSALSGLRGRNGLVGRGWRLSYETTLHLVRDAIHVVQADGSRLVFRRSAKDPTRFLAEDPARGFVHAGSTTDADAFLWHWTHGDNAGRKLGFDRSGRLIRITAATGEFVSLLYDTLGALRKVTDPQGRSLEFHYPDRRQARAAGRYAGVARIVSPDGDFHYAYGTEPLPGEDAATIAARRLALISVTDSGAPGSASQRRYHYEDARHPTLLTGISIEASDDAGRRTSRRLSTYGYDAAGRGVLSAGGFTQSVANDTNSRGADIVRLRFESLASPGRPGTTVLTNADGQMTRYKIGVIGGQNRILESSGAGCWRCGRVNLRYRYDEMGRLVEKQRLAPDDGRASAALRISRDRVGRVHRIDRIEYSAGKPDVARMVQRFEYSGEDPLPTLVARPSAFPGRETRLFPRFNAQGQIVEVRETGYAPAIAHDGQVRNWEPIERTILFRYVRLNGRSVLAEVDGPLPNGPSGSPADSDITRYTHDETGNRVVAVTHPMNLSERFTYDLAGRIVGHVPIDGVAIRIDRDGRGRPLRWQRGEAVVEVTRDNEGRPLRITLADGEVRALGHDGREGLGAMLSSSGEGWWLKPGSITPIQPPGAASAEASSRAETHSRQGTRAGAPFEAWMGLRTWHDDFGRLVALRTEATGIEFYRHDLAGRMLERRFADGWVWRWTRDAAGRIGSHSVQAPHDASPTITELSYRGAHLWRMAHPQEIETRRHDAFGRIIERTVRRPPPGESGSAMDLEYREQYAYDAADRLTRHQLAEGGEVRYEWGAGDHLRAIDWIDGRQRTTRLIAPLPRPSHAREAHAFASSSYPSPAKGGYRFGNGIEARLTRAPDGRLTALAHIVPSSNDRSDWTGWLPAANAAANVEGVIDGWRYAYDAHGRIVQRTDESRHIVTSYAFDAREHLIAAQSNTGRGDVEYYAYDTRGQPMGRLVQGATEDFRAASEPRTPGGLPVRAGTRLLRYSADRRLAEVRNPNIDNLDAAAGLVVARYDHNALGQRIRKRVFNPKGAEPAADATQYLWDGYRLAAEVKEGSAGPVLSRRYIHAHGVPVAVIDYPDGRTLSARSGRLIGAFEDWWQFLTGRAAQVHYVHTNEIGTPTAVTNADQRVVWRATHTVYGETTAISDADPTKPFLLNIRLPGQYYDAETGWHDNVLRTYDPQRGQYLEPDPLGPHRMTRPYAYAAGNPLMYADPLGLILFAFDGTGNDESSRTNIYWLRDAYDDNDPTGVADSDRPFYIEGVGTEWYAVGDAALAYRLKRKVIIQLDRLDNYVRVKWDREVRNGASSYTRTAPLMITLDVIGFSRGAAAARDFVNEVLTRRNAGYYPELAGGACLDLRIRFVGLFDTVLSAQINGTISLGIPADQIGRLAHAVGVNEHRTLFPLESAEASYGGRGGRSNVIERAFIGAHSDIGGGYVVEDGGDLSDIALNWMYAQAESAGVKLLPLEDEQRTVSKPLLHDESRVWPWNTYFFNRGSDDREVRYSDGFFDQRKADVNGMKYSKSLEFIAPLPDIPVVPNPYVDGDAVPVPAPSNKVGTVDMERYGEWLERTFKLSM